MKNRSLQRFSTGVKLTVMTPLDRHGRVLLESISISVSQFDTCELCWSEVGEKSSIHKSKDST